MVAFAYVFAFGLLLGFSLTIPPGPMNALIASQSVASMRRGVITGLGAMSADLVLGVAVYLLETHVDLHEFVRWVYVLGCGVMAFFGYRLLARRPEEGAPETGELRTYSAALGLGLSNPFQILWWLTAGLAFAYLGGLVLFAGLFGAIAVWIIVFPGAMHAGVRRHPRVGRFVTWASGGILIALAIYFAVLAT
jgi:threonine/homoserine/homoserine lactone efflux protein